MSQDTIFALSSGAPPSGIAVVRLSGPGVRFGLETLIGEIPVPRKLIGSALLDPRDGRTLDRGLAVFFPAPASFTGEDVAEFHVHGGRAVVAGVLAALGSLPGFRLAVRGEFTRRAFENGKIDLAEAEGIADLVAAETEMQRRQALDQASGALSGAYEEWRRRLTVARGMLEADIDFAEGEDLPESVSERAWEEVAMVRAGIGRALEGAARGERLRDGIEVVILGPPNAGKSSLLNWFARREAAIVSAEPGTTRDLVEVRLDLSGFPLTLTDTAGLRAAAANVEREGMRRALARAGAADIVLLLQEATQRNPPAAPALPSDVPVLRLATKIDLLDSEAEQTWTDGRLPVSVVTGAGLEVLSSELLRLVEMRFGAREPVLVTRQRHADSLRACAAALERATVPGLPVELAAEELRNAGDALARVTGRIDVEDWLDVIFAEFCIGK